jgi:hypothetical protein
MTSPEIDQWYEATDLEIKALQNKHTIIEIKRSQVPPGSRLSNLLGFFAGKSNQTEKYTN